MPVARARERGKCVNCGKPAVAGRVRCEPCQAVARQRAAAWRAADPARLKAATKRWYRAHKAKGLCLMCNSPRVEGRSHCEKHLAVMREDARRRQANGSAAVIKIRWRKHHRDDLFSLYGLTREEYEHLLASQGHRCAICGRREFEQGRKRFHIDHDHRFARGDKRGVRGILCRECNTSLGKFGDDLAGLRRALEYLERFEETVRPRLVESA